MWDFEHEPEKSRLAERYDIRYSTPSRCAEDLFTGVADIGLVPAAAYAIDPTMLILPGCAIASKARIRSIILVTREDGPESANIIALDTSSLTSATYTEILFRKYWNPEAKFLPHAPNLDAMLAAADAALLIGDPALLALEDSQARLDRTGETLLYYDVGYEWMQRTGVPWVSAFWAIRGVAAKELSLPPRGPHFGLCDLAQSGTRTHRGPGGGMVGAHCSARDRHSHLPDGEYPLHPRPELQGGAAYFLSLRRRVLDSA